MRARLELSRCKRIDEAFMRNSRRFPTRATAAHIRELSSMSVESVCCSSSSRAAPACEQARSGQAAERGIVLNMYQGVLREAGGAHRAHHALIQSSTLR